MHWSRDGILVLLVIDFEAQSFWSLLILVLFDDEYVNRILEREK